MVKFYVFQAYLCDRFLEWDYGSDLGYVDSQLTQGQAAQSLSTLEKLAIGNYSEFLRDSDQDEINFQSSTHRRGSGLPLLPDGFDQQTDLKMRKFADSLMRQRQLRELELTDSRRQQHMREQELPRVERRRSTSRDRAGGAKIPATGGSGSSQSDSLSPYRAQKGKHPLSDTDPRSLPVLPRGFTTRSSSDVLSSPDKRKNDKLPQVRRSTSLTDVSDLSSDKVAKKRSFSNTALCGARQGSGPSSSSSCATVVNSRRTKLSAAANYRTEDTDQLPHHLRDVFVETDRDTELQSSKLSVQSRQSSKRSNSFETVIGVDKYHSSGKDSFDTDEDLHNPVLRDLTQEERERKGKIRRNAWMDKSSEERSMSRPVNSGNSSLPSTSDEDVGRRRRLGQEDTSTLESVQMIDRAKSFEYIPGESFPLQENSSSYEYLPGKIKFFFFFFLSKYFSRSPFIV